LESDYSINEDYSFDSEDRRQFYIRREILRAIASHTCNDIYQLYMTSFSFLLRICDDTQEWGRKNITELYVDKTQKYQLDDIDLYLGKDNKNGTCKIKEAFELKDVQEVISLIDRLRDQSLVYVNIFRDGQDTVKRNFSFERILIIACQGVSITLNLNIKKDSASELKGLIEYASDNEINKMFASEFFDNIDIDWKNVIEIKNRDGKKIYNIKKDVSGKINESKFDDMEYKVDTEDNEDIEYSEWSKGEFYISLSI
jgi:hypothetical protein